MTRDEATAVVNALFDSWYEAMVRYAARLSGSVEEAEEVVQEAFLGLFDELLAGKAIENPRAWTFCVVRRGAGRRLRHHLKREVPLEEMDLLDTMAVPPGMEGDGDLDRMLAVLTRRETEVVMLRLESMKYREIGSALGISSNSVNVLLARALRKLQAFVGSGPVRPRATGVARKWEGANDSETLQ
ncbi:MAG: sigma-70 family RNA polymerase sigma factor [Bryobacterales bacterium]|nr:sigma-70 family RNA polymerase sigma factor [Bryobacterales bacterium]